ncbi:MAG: chloride channel protein [Halanaerobiales bacterium]|nr:chloride channel protein [Halanaerobiales bacterium]
MNYKNNLYLFIVIILLGLPATIFTHLFFFLIDQISINIINYFANNILLIFIPAIGGLIVGYLLNYGTLTAKGHGVPLLISTIKSNEKGLTKKDLHYEGLATSFTVISGGSVGLVGPIIELTTGISDIIGRYLNFELKEYQIIIGSAAAASFSAVFMAPFAATIFSLEVIHKDWSLKNIFYTISASFSSFLLMNLINPGYEYFFNFEILIEGFGRNQYIFLIIFTFLISLVGWLFINTLVLSESIFSKLDIPFYYKPACGGLLVGIVGYFYFEVLGTGSNIISNFNNLDTSILFISSILILKIIATSLSIGSGGSGGLFAPMILTGLLSGFLVGKIGLIFWPAFAINPIFLALCGLVGILAGLIKAPIASIILVLELFYLPNLIVPIILASFIPFIILNLMKVRSIYSPELFNKEL